MKKKDLSTLDLPALQKKRDKASIIQKIVLGMIIFYIAFIIYTFLAKEWEVDRLAPLVGGLAALVAATASLRKQLTQVEEEIARRSPLRS